MTCKFISELPSSQSKEEKLSFAGRTQRPQWGCQESCLMLAGCPKALGEGGKGHAPSCSSGLFPLILSPSHTAPDSPQTTSAEGEAGLAEADLEHVSLWPRVRMLPLVWLLPLGDGCFQKIQWCHWEWVPFPGFGTQSLTDAVASWPLGSWRRPPRLSGQRGPGLGVLTQGRTWVLLPETDMASLSFQDPRLFLPPRSAVDPETLMTLPLRSRNGADRGLLSVAGLSRKSLDGRGLFGPIPARHREDSSVSGAHHPVHLLPSASPCLEGPDPGGSPFSLPGREPALEGSPNAPRPPVIPPRGCAGSLAGAGTKGKRRKPSLVCRPGWRRRAGVLVAMARVDQDVCLFLSPSLAPARGA
ncbi:uncharacterized protein LOC125107101 [Lutra lutra]|uniref:uncharacterized protein LOC125107101 n=1 Tax=Lutra lutra TaxID=9657 RepID=UPI001FD2E61D|nr:uncharacterized protein LOC125107101 [Lutra lutra]XP_047597766.1 uncharacterized protein LOC125107101 [Lutra lutra]